MTVYIKNMVCVRCVMAVKAVLADLDMSWTELHLGKAELCNNPDGFQLKQLDLRLREYELELMEDRKQILVERIKTHIIEMLHTAELDQRLKLSESLSQALFYDYTYLSNHFSEMEGSTIERFYLSQRTERVKELIVYEGLNVSEIAFRLQFSSVSHLCAQFRKIAGMTPAAFRRLTQRPDFHWREMAPGSSQANQNVLHATQKNRTAD